MVGSLSLRVSAVSGAAWPEPRIRSELRGNVLRVRARGYACPTPCSAAFQGSILNLAWVGEQQR